MRLEEISEISLPLREAYLRSLPEAQELYIENLVQAARKALILEGERIIGYAAVHGATLVEFFILDSELQALRSAFDLVVQELRVSRALCKTFDARMLTAASSKPARVKTVGLLFRLLVPSALGHGPEIFLRPGALSDMGLILTMHDCFFDSPQEVESYIREGGLFLGETLQNELVGCGVIKRIVPGDNYFDIGMVVAPWHRRGGFGAQIIAQLKAHCVNAGFRPVAGCAADNVASRRALERAGFRSAHSLLEFLYDKA